jgi:hypothetical protein
MWTMDGHHISSSQMITKWTIRSVDFHALYIWDDLDTYDIAQEIIARKKLGCGDTWQKNGMSFL